MPVLSRVEIRSKAGTLYGVIATPQQWTSRELLDGAGTFEFQMPLDDPNAALVQNKRLAYGYGVLDGVDTQIGAGVIERLSAEIGAGAPVLKVAGDDLLSELADIPVGMLELYTTDERHSDHVYRLEDNANYEDWSTELTDGETTTYRTYHFGSNDSLLICDHDAPFNRIRCGFNTYYNTDKAGLRIWYWNGSAWAETDIISDGTSVAGVTLAQDGVIRFERHGDWAKSTIEGQNGYWLKLSPDESLDNTHAPRWGYINVIEELADPAPLAHVFALPAVVAAGWSLDVNYHTEAEHAYYGRFLNGESVLEALRAIAEQTGEHFRVGMGRTVQWLGDDQTAAPVTAVRDTGSERLWDNDAVAIIRSLKYQIDSYELVTRVYPYGAETTLEHCTRTAPSGYTLDKANNCIISTAQETALGEYRCDRTMRWNGIGSVAANVTADANASDALYDTALAWLKAHDRVITSLDVDLVKVNQMVRPGQKLTIDFHTFITGYEMVSIDASYWVLEVENTVTDLGILECKPKLASSDYRQATDEDELANLVSGVNQLSGDTTVIISNAATAGTHSAVVDGGPWKSTDWNGDTKSGANNGVVDLSAAFGLPAGIRGVFISFNVTTSDADNDEHVVGFFIDADHIPGGSAWGGADGVFVQMVNGKFRSAHGFVPCDPNGDIYFYTSAASGDNLNIWVVITGYLL